MALAVVARGVELLVVMRRLAWRDGRCWAKCKINEYIDYLYVGRLRLRPVCYLFIMLYVFNVIYVRTTYGLVQRARVEQNITYLAYAAFV